MIGVAARDDGCDPAGAKKAAVLVVVVAAVTDHLVGAAARPSDKAGDCGYTVEQRDQLGAVMAVAAGERERERDPGRVDEEMML